MDENMKAAVAVLFADAGRNGERFFNGHYGNFSLFIAPKSKKSVTLQSVKKRTPLYSEILNILYFN